LIATGGFALAAGAAFAETVPEAAAIAVTKSARRVYYASDFGIFPKATMPATTPQGAISSTWILANGKPLSDALR